MKPINKAGQLLYNTLKNAVKIKEYQRGYLKNVDGSPKTFCNVMSRDLLDCRMPKVWIMGYFINTYDYDISAIRPESGLIDVILNTPCNIAYDNLKKAINEHKVTSISAYPAQLLANMGIPIHVITKKPGHEAIVCPCNNYYHKDRGPYIGQAGWNNGLYFISDNKSWGKNWQEAEPLFIIYPRFEGRNIYEYFTDH
jgi:hypothetical protein